MLLGLRPRPSLSVLVHAAIGNRHGRVAGASAPAFVERHVHVHVVDDLTEVLLGLRPRPSLSGGAITQLRGKFYRVAGASAPAFVERLSGGSTFHS